MNRRLKIFAAALMMCGTGLCLVLVALAPWRWALAGLLALIVCFAIATLGFLRRVLRVQQEMLEHVSRLQNEGLERSAQISGQVETLGRELPERVAIRSAVDLARFRKVMLAERHSEVETVDLGRSD